MSYVSAVPAYGRDYKSQKEVKAAWEEGKDFRIQAMMMPEYDGQYVNKDNCPPGLTLNIRYKRLTQVCVIKPKK
jgi:hypothetical protein